MRAGGAGESVDFRLEGFRLERHAAMDVKDEVLVLRQLFGGFQGDADALVGA